MSVNLSPTMHVHGLRPDEVAETWGVSQPTYVELWGIITHPAYPKARNYDDDSPEPAEGARDLTTHWHRLTPTAQAEINALGRRKTLEHMDARSLHEEQP